MSVGEPDDSDGVDVDIPPEGSADKTNDTSEENSERLGPAEYLGYRIIREREEQDDQPTSRSKFWKLCCIADRRISDETDIDTDFPRHWYKYGETVDPQSMSQGFKNAPSARFWEGQEILSDREIPVSDFEISTEQEQVISRTARRVVEKHGTKSASDLVEYQYTNHPPNEFVQKYGELRAQLKAVDLEKQALLPDFDDESRSPILVLLDDMIRTFPEEEYSEIYQLYLKWDDTARLLLAEGGSYHQLEQFLEIFVERLSETVLRFEENNGNIPEERVAEWQEAKPEQLDALRDEIDGVREALLSNREASGELEKVAESYDEAILEALRNR